MIARSDSIFDLFDDVPMSVTQALKAASLLVEPIKVIRPSITIIRITVAETAAPISVPMIFAINSGLMNAKEITVMPQRI